MIYAFIIFSKHRIWNSLFILLALLFVLNGCGLSEKNNTDSAFLLPYELGESDTKYKLPEKLVEISGLSYINDSTIACVQDEEGSVYMFNPRDGRVRQKIDFGKDGDYEGVEYINGIVYVVRSSGKLYEIDSFGATSQKTTKFKTILMKANNPEGLAYDPVHERLLISGRGRPGDEKSVKAEYTIYGFEMDTKELTPEPLITFTSDDIYDFLGKSTLKKVHDRATNFILPGSIDILAFHPSGIAVHPFTEDIYIVAAKGGILTVLSHKGKIRYIVDLPEVEFKEPAGITFLPNGDLLIANEGQDGLGNIRRFNYIKPVE